MRRLATLVAATLALPCAGWAQDAAQPVTLSAFGTLSGVRTDTDLGQYATSLLQPNGAAKTWDFTVDSLIAGQIDAKATDKLSFTLQVVANKTAQDTFEPHVEWAFGRYTVSPTLQVRGGVMSVPVFMLSDSRLVGLSYPWARVPTALYSQVPVTNFAGADVVYRPSFGGTTLTLQPYYGVAHPHVPSDPAHGDYVKADLKPIAGLNIVAENGPWTARAGYFASKFTYPGASLHGLLDTLRSLDAMLPGAASLADSLDPSAKRTTFLGAGVSYDSRNVFLQAEFGKRKSDSFLADTTSWYATGGYRFGNFMPHITFSQTKVQSPTSQSVVPPVGELQPLADGLNGFLSEENPAQKAVAIGLRYQLGSNADLKVQWDRVKMPDGARGSFVNVQPGLPNTVNVYSAVLDFVF
jgi:hypothetical protein